jgi:hypothetical protein
MCSGTVAKTACEAEDASRGGSENLYYAHCVPRFGIVPAFGQVIVLWSAVCETVGFSRRDIRKARI